MAIDRWIFFKPNGDFGGTLEAGHPFQPDHTKGCTTVPYPETGVHRWDEPTQQWIEKKFVWFYDPVTLMGTTLDGLDITEPTPENATEIMPDPETRVPQYFSKFLKRWTTEAVFDPMAYIRKVRDALLDDTDWTQMPDNPLAPEVKAAWATYRQQLRDFPGSLTLQEGDTIESISWPLRPDEV
jgi:hypothetical protein